MHRTKNLDLVRQLADGLAPTCCVSDERECLSGELVYEVDVAGILPRIGRLAIYPRLPEARIEIGHFYAKRMLLTRLRDVVCWFAVTPSRPRNNNIKNH